MKSSWSSRYLPRAQGRQGTKPLHVFSMQLRPTGLARRVSAFATTKLRPMGSAAQPALAGASQSDMRSRRIRTWSLFAAGDDGSYRGSARHKAAVLVRHHSHKPQSRTPMCQQTESPQHHHVPYMPRGYNSQNHATQHLKGSRPGGQPYTIGMPWYTGCSISTNTSRAIL